MLAIIKTMFTPKMTAKQVADSVEICEMSANSWWS